MRAYPPLKYLGTTQSVSYTGTAARTTNGVGAQTRVVRIVCTTAAFIVFGGSAVNATTSDLPKLEANVAEDFVIQRGQYVSAIRSASDGTMYVSEMA